MFFLIASLFGMQRVTVAHDAGRVGILAISSSSGATVLERNGSGSPDELPLLHRRYYVALG